MQRELGILRIVASYRFAVLINVCRNRDGTGGPGWKIVMDGGEDLLLDVDRPSPYHLIAAAMKYREQSADE